MKKQLLFALAFSSGFVINGNQETQQRYASLHASIELAESNKNITEEDLIAIEKLTPNFQGDRQNLRETIEDMRNYPDIKNCMSLVAKEMKNGIDNKKSDSEIDSDITSTQQLSGCQEIMQNFFKSIILPRILAEKEQRNK